jgi:response regulator of citrate/malate metabolism
MLVEWQIDAALAVACTTTQTRAQTYNGIISQDLNATTELRQQHEQRHTAKVIAEAAASYCMSKAG